MNKKFNVPISVLLVLTLTACIFVSCADKNSAGSGGGSESVNKAGQDAETNETGETETVRLYPDVPEKNYDGYSFIILNIDPSTMHWATHTLVAEQQNGDVLNDSIYNRNMEVEEKLGIKVENTIVAHSAIASKIQSAVAADLHEFDAAMLGIEGQGNLGHGGYLANWKDVPYVNLEKPWWSKATNDEISIKNRLFFAAGDISIAYYDAVMPLAMNITMANNYNLETPYELVLSSKWTADKEAEMMKAVTEDLDGDGVMTVSDRFGMFGMSEEYSALLIAFNEKYIIKDNDDVPYLAINAESFQRAFEKAIQTMNNDDVFLNYRLPRFDKTGSGLSLVHIFPNGQALFTSDVLFHLSKYRSMEDDIAILPRPKYDEAQEKYYSYIHPSAVLMCIPSTNPDIERTGIILETLAAYSKYTVIETYYNIVLSQKYARDESSIKMLDIIFGDRVADLGSIFNWGSVRSSVEKQGTESNTDIASLYAKIGTQVKTAIEKIIE